VSLIGEGRLRMFELYGRITELEERVKQLEHILYRKDVEDCPRCGQHTMHYLQTGVCFYCAYQIGDDL
jgi:hypothetical protein